MDKIKNFKGLVILFGVVLVLYVGFWIGIAWKIKTPELRGQFGDMFGSVNALFSGLAMAGVVYAIFLQRLELQAQREELRLQRKEIELNRTELSRTARAQEESEKALREQVSNMELTAKINGYSSLLNATELMLNRAVDLYGFRTDEVIRTRVELYDKLHREIIRLEEKEAKRQQSQA